MKIIRIPPTTLPPDCKGRDDIFSFRRKAIAEQRVRFEKWIEASGAAVTITPDSPDSMFVLYVNCDDQAASEIEKAFPKWTVVENKPCNLIRPVKESEAP